MTEEAVKEDEKKVIETLTDVEPTKNVDDLISSLKVTREEVKPPPLIDDINFFGGEAPHSESEENEQTEEAISDDDEANLEYLKYTDEHKNTAMFLIMTLDRGMGFLSNVISKDHQHDFSLIKERKDISQDYLDVTAAIVKKYQAKLSLETVLIMTIIALYAPNLYVAYTKRLSNNASTKKENKTQND